MKMSISRKMLVGIVLLILFESAVVTVYFSVDTARQVRRRTEDGMREALISNARMLNAILDDIVDSAQLMCVDTKMRDLLQALHAPGVRGRMNWEDGMRKIVFNYFGSAVSDYDAYIYDINIFSEDFEYSDQNVFAYTCADVQGTGLTGALERRPYYVWEPTTDARAHLTERMKRYAKGTDARIDTKVFRLIKRMNISTVEGEAIQKLPREIPPPYLVVSISPGLLYNTFSPDGLTPGSTYMIVTSEGRIVSGEDIAKNGSYLQAPSVINALLEGEGYRCGMYAIDGEEALVGMLPANVSDWFYICAVPEGDITHSARETFALYIRLLALVCAATLILSAFFIRKTLRPVRELAQRAAHIANAPESALGLDSPRETDRIMTVIESMNERIERLAENNVELERREKDANILMLEMQINPHFLYNSLNKLHIRLLSAGQGEIAEQVIALSGALRYSVDTKAHLVYLYKDIEQLGLYLASVQSENENRFAVYYDIDEPLYDAIVPKMLLQPFVENSILHGFREAAFGCLIHIEGTLQDGDVLIVVSDNGTGIPEERKELLLSGGGGGHIGCANVHKRIQLLFGEKYGVSVLPAQSGARIAIRLPYLFEK
ncbi:histidine kinase [Beduinella massiliensis]|uniref:histidine kinase n=1 Tax=Beduinella massiliensis TaxID=1852363 RepID=UPI000C8581A8